MDPLAFTPFPLKRHPALQSYSRDHHFGLLLAWKIRKGCSKGVPAERISSYVLRSFASELRPHFRDEEQFLLTHLPAGSELVERTLREHARLEQLIEAWSMQTPAHEALECFASLLDAHIRFEERELFPFLQAELPAQALQALENMERSGRDDVDSRWDDHFWLDKAIRD